MPHHTAAATADPRYTTSRALHVRAGEGPTYWVSGDVYTLKATRETTEGSLGFVEASVPPGGGPVAHVHTRCDESFYIVAGELEVLDGGRTFIARTGDFVFIPRGTRHRFKNTGVHAVKLVFLFSPGGDELGLALGDAAKPGEPPTPWGPERFAAPEFVRFNAQAGVVILPE
jgi:mannose-6-phosphate isomerase-like protein (cupin superfamily)